MLVVECILPSLSSEILRAFEAAVRMVQSCAIILHHLDSTHAPFLTFQQEIWGQQYTRMASTAFKFIGMNVSIQKTASMSPQKRGETIFK